MQNPLCGKLFANTLGRVILSASASYHNVCVTNCRCSEYGSIRGRGGAHSSPFLHRNILIGSYTTNNDELLNM